MKIIQAFILALVVSHLLGCVASSPTDNTKPPVVKIDTDHDGLTDDLDTDDDNDGTPDLTDKFPLDAKEQKDSDGDGIGDNTDLDDDNDGTLDISDKFPLDPKEQKDTDNDGIGDNSDPDADNDGTPNLVDKFPLDANEQKDFDGDGIGDNADLDDDNDGISDDVDPLLATAINTKISIPTTAKLLVDKSRGLLFISSRDENKLTIVRLADGKIAKTIQFENHPESMVLAADRKTLYVALLVSGHQYYGVNDGTGKIAVIDLDQLALSRTFDLNLDPFDMVITDKNKLIISSGSGQWTRIAAYDATTGVALGSSDIRHLSYITLDPTQHWVFSADTDLSPQDVKKYDVSVDNIAYSSEMPYQGDYPIGGKVWVDPAGKFLLTRAGTVFLTSDMSFVKNIAAGNSLIKQIEFDAGSNTAILLSDDNSIIVLNLAELEVVKTITSTEAVLNISFQNGFMSVLRQATNGTSRISLEEHPCSSCKTNRAPVAEFSTLPSSGDTTQTFNFDASLSTDADGDKLQYRWDFDGDNIWDTEFSNSPKSSFKYIIAGNYSVKVQVKDAISSKATQTKKITVNNGKLPGTPVLNSNPNIFSFPVSNGVFDGKSTLYYLDTQNKRVYLVNLKSGLTTKYFDTFSTPVQIILSADKTQIYILQNDSLNIGQKSLISSIDTAEQLLTNTIAVGAYVRQLLDVAGDSFLSTPSSQLSLVNKKTGLITSLNTYPNGSLAANEAGDKIYSLYYNNIDQYSLTGGVLNRSSQTLQNNTGSGFGFNDLSAWVSPDETLFVSSSGGIYSSLTKEFLESANNGQITKTLFDRTRNLVFILGADGLVYVYNSHSLQLIKQINAGKSIQDIIISDEHFYLMVSGPSGTAGLVEYPHPCLACANNLAPTTLIKANPNAPLAGQVTRLDASASVDEMIASLLFRWDFNGDGKWDTPFLATNKQEKIFILPGVKFVSVQARDIYGETNTATTVFNVNRADIVANDSPDALATLTPDLSLFIPGKNLMVVTDKTTSKLYFVDLLSGQPTKYFGLEFSPERLSITPDGNTLYVLLSENPEIRSGMKQYIARIDINTLTLNNIFPLAEDYTSNLTAISATRLMVFRQGSYYLDLIDSDSGESKSTLFTYGYASGITSSDGKTIYIGGRYKFRFDNDKLVQIKEGQFGSTAERGWLVPGGNKIIDSAKSIYDADTLSYLGYLTTTSNLIIDATFNTENRIGYLLMSDGNLLVINTDSMEIIKTLANWGQSKAIVYRDGFLYGLTSATGGWAITSAANPCLECINNKAPIAKITVNANIVDINTELTFSAKDSTDPEQSPLTYRWDINGDGVWDGEFSAVATRNTIFPIPGLYSVAVQVRDNIGNIAEARLDIDVQQQSDHFNGVSFGEPNTLYFLPKAIEVDSANGVLYSLNSTSKRVYLTNIDNGVTDQAIQLENTPEAIAISPNGKFIYIAQLGSGHTPQTTSGQFGFISIIDTQSRSLVKTFQINSDPADIAALKGNLLAVSSGSGQRNKLVVLNMDNGQIVASFQGFGAAKLVADTSGSYFYQIDTEIVPGNIIKYQTDNLTGSGSTQNIAPYLSTGFNFWLSVNGDSIISATGNIFRADTFELFNTPLASPTSVVRNVANTSDGASHLLVSDQVVGLDPITFSAIDIKECRSCVDIFASNNQLFALKNENGAMAIIKLQ